MTRRIISPLRYPGRACEAEVPAGRPEFHKPLPPPTYWPSLFVLMSELFCLFLVIANIRSRYIVDPDRMSVIEFSNQNPPVKVRDHADITGGPVLVEPCRVFFGKRYVDSFVLAFLWIVNSYFHKLPSFPFFLEALFEPIAVPWAVDDMGFMC